MRFSLGLEVEVEHTQVKMANEPVSELREVARGWSWLWEGGELGQATSLEERQKESES